MIKDLYFKRPLNDVYDVEGYTTSEILSVFYSKFKEIITAFNNIDKQLVDKANIYTIENGKIVKEKIVDN